MFVLRWRVDSLIAENFALLGYYAVSSVNNPKERSSQLPCNGSLESRTLSAG
jgi:hypothetical protein